MGRRSLLFTLLTLVCVILPHGSTVKCQPLYTSSRWIVNESGERVKLACVNWVAHLDAVVAEGLSKQPVDVISKGIRAMGFNCVRLTWPLWLVTNDSLASLTVRQSFQNLGLLESIAGIQTNNPSVIDLTLLQAYQVVVRSLGDNNVMVVLDNHVTQPEWCCSNFDGSGFFGDRYFDPDLWITGLTKMAATFSATTNVVGMSLRNELRGPKQNVKDWYRYMSKGAEAVHAANPNVLVILSGLNYDKDLSFLRNQQVKLSFEGKLVFEMHWYAFTDGPAWESGNVNQVCGQVAGNVMRMSGFLLEQGWPLFVTEHDLDWAYWTLVGSYYIREGVIGRNEYYGLLTWDWSQVRNTSFLQRISALQLPFRGPGFSEARSFKVIFHPLTGLCVVRKSLLDPLMLGPCSRTEHWRYTPQKILTIKGTYFCLQADQVGKPAQLGIICNGPNSKWEMISDSKMHLSSTASDGSTVCLDVDSNNVLVTNTCKCLSRDRTCDPGSQWFKLVDSTRSSISTKLTLPASDSDSDMADKSFSSM
ncbi:hypothetical protein L6164_025205 [Bauhinia variegata]|uniref:Uncharacterized protein n=1 Tax=Bauhinia variegata TaxID=167791 RepID=A0ACB9M1H2_BAUVA|nr:hypothetical protein L6164_025205 [Bauhinia variegata]